MEQREVKQIDFVEIFKKLKKHIKLFAISIPIAAVAAYLLICCIPRTYDCTVKLAPESSSNNLSSLGALASSYGIDMGMIDNSSNTDAIGPDLYPDLMESVDFKTSLFNVPVTSKDKKIKTTYYNYLLNYQKTAWWEDVAKWFVKLFKKNKANDGNAKVNAFQLTKTQTKIAKRIGDNVSCEIDRKNDVIMITVKDQDPVIAACMADTAKARLQDFITEYRTKKARTDLNYITKIWKDSKAKYQKIRRTYAAYSDANTDVTLPSVQSKLEDIENDMQLEYNTYTAMSQQLQKARARLIEQTPAFTTLQSATVPVRPSGPKRLIFTLIIVCIVFMIDVAVAVNKG